MCRDGTGTGGRLWIASILVEISPFGRGGHCQRGQSHRCWAAPGDGPSAAAGRSCWQSAGRWGLRATGPSKLTAGYRLRAPVCPHAGSHLAGWGAGEAALLSASCYRSACFGGDPQHPHQTSAPYPRSLRVSVAAGVHRGLRAIIWTSWRTMPAGAVRMVRHSSRRQRSTAGPGTSGTRRARTSG